MDPNTRNILVLVAVVAVIYLFCKSNKEQFSAIASAPFDGPADDDAAAPAAGAPMATSFAASPTVAGGLTGATVMTAVPAAAAAQAADAAWQSGAKSINPYATNFVDSRAMDGSDSISGYTRKNSTWDVRGAVPIQRDPSVSFFGQSSRMPPPPTDNKVFCATS